MYVHVCMYVCMHVYDINTSIYYVITAGHIIYGT